MHPIKADKKGFFLTLAGGILMLVVVYRIAVIPTIDITKEYKSIQAQMGKIENAPGRLAALESEIATLDKVIGRTNTTGDYQGAILQEISRYCTENNTLLREFPAAQVFRNSGYEHSVSNAITEGKYSELLGLLHTLETGDCPGSILSVRFYMFNDRRSDATKLNMSVLIQTVKKSENEINDI